MPLKSPNPLAWIYFKKNQNNHGTNAFKNALWYETSKTAGCVCKFKDFNYRISKMLTSYEIVETLVASKLLT
jgi:hypothetical protein